MSSTAIMLYYEYREHFECLSDEECGALVKALLAYGEEGTLPENLTGSARIAFSFIRRQIDRDNEKYDERCEKNRSNGKKGGRPAADKEKTERFSGETEKTEWFSEETQKNRMVISENPEKPNGYFEKPKKPNEKENEKENENENLSLLSSSSDEDESSTADGGCLSHDVKDQVISAWNDNGLAKIKGIENDRAKLLRARIRQYSLNDVLDAIRSVRSSPFLMGEVTNFVCTIDWLLKPNNFPKVLEGNYLPRGEPKGEPAKSPPKQGSAEDLNDFYNRMSAWAEGG